MEGKSCIQQRVRKCAGISSFLFHCLCPAVFNGSLVPLAATASYCLSCCVMLDLEGMDKKLKDDDLLNRLPAITR